MARLGDITTVVTGGTPSTGISEYWENGDIPWLQSGCCQNCDVVKTDKYITQIGYENCSAKLMPIDTVMIALTGATAGKVGYLTFPACGNQSITGILPCEQLNQRFLYYFLMSKRETILRDCVGGAQPHISQGYVKGIEIPIVSIHKQEQIVEKLIKVDKLIMLLSKQLFKFDKLIKSKFIEMFGNPVYNANNLPSKKLSQLGVLERGKSQHRPRNAPELLNGPYPLIQTGDVANAGLYITEYNNTYSELGLAQSKMWKKDTMCITIAANIAQTAILTFDACFPDSVVGFCSYGEIDVVYLHYWFSFFQRILEEQAPQVAQKNINLKILSDLDVMLPKKDEQQMFVNYVEQTEQLKSEVNQSLEKLETLKKALMQKYFG